MIRNLIQSRVMKMRIIKLNLIEKMTRKMSELMRITIYRIKRESSPKRNNQVKKLRRKLVSE